MLAKRGHVEVHQQPNPEPWSFRYAACTASSAGTALDLEHDSTLDDEIGLIRVFHPPLLVDMGQQRLSNEPQPAPLHLVSDALPVRRLQEPRGDDSRRCTRR